MALGANPVPCSDMGQVYPRPRPELDPSRGKARGAFWRTGRFLLRSTAMAQPPPSHPQLNSTHLPVPTGNALPEIQKKVPPQTKTNKCTQGRSLSPWHALLHAYARACRKQSSSGVINTFTSSLSHQEQLRRSQK